MVKDYRNKVGSKTGGIKLHAELKANFTEANIRLVETSSIASSD
ncbi:hypothetical protein [Winogradskyella undariae]|nr:hypothetical protein [Winogradskyella undariae]